MPPETSPEKPDDGELRAAGDRIETLLAELAAEGPRVGPRAEELVQLLLRLYGAGIERILAAVDAEGPAADRVFARLAGDDLVASLLVLHGLHPLDLASRIARALDRVRPFLGSHGGDVALLGVENGVARLRLLGSCHGCPSSSVTMKLAVERAIGEAAPEIVRIEVEGALAEGPGPATGAAAPALVQIGEGARRGGNAARSSRPEEERAWQAQPATPLISPS